MGISRRAFAGALPGLGLGLAGLCTFGSAGPAAARGRRAEQRQQTERHNAEVIASLFDVEVPFHDWKWIVVHHTATAAASLAGIDAYHRNHFGDPLGAEYHFVINNGRKLPMGFIEVARWRHQVPAWHLFVPERAPDGIAICLVGNFEERALERGQLDALVELSAALMRGLSIDIDHVTTHRGVDGILTQCPGKHFPRARFLEQLHARAVAHAAAAEPQPPSQTPLFAGPALRCVR